MNRSSRLIFTHKPILWVVLASLWISPSRGLAFGTSKDLDDWSMVLSKRFKGSLKNNAETVLCLSLEREDKAVTELGRILSEKLTGKLQEKNISKTVDKDFSFKLSDELKGNGQSLEEPQTLREAGKFSGANAVITGKIHLTKEKLKVTLQLYDSETARLIKKTSRSLMANSELINLYSREVNPPQDKSPLLPLSERGKYKVTPFRKGGNTGSLPLQKGETTSQSNVPVLEIAPDFVKVSRDYLAMQKKFIQVSGGKTMIKADPGSNQDMAALEFIARGHIYFETLDYFSAVNAYTKALSLKPDIYESYLFRGIAFYKKNAILKTLEDFNKCADLRPEDPSVWVLLGMAYVKNSESSRAVSDFTKAISLDPKSGEAYYERGQIQQSQDDFIAGCNLGWAPACDALKKFKR